MEKKCKFCNTRMDEIKQGFLCPDCGEFILFNSKTKTDHIKKDILNRQN